MIFTNKNNKYELKNIIAKGGFSMIYKVLDKNNKIFALKFFSFAQNVKLKEQFENEIEVMKNIKNKYIIELKDNFYDEINEGYI